MKLALTFRPGSAFRSGTLRCPVKTNLRVNSFSSAIVSTANPLRLTTKLAAAVSSRAAGLFDFTLQNTINPTAELRVISPEAPEITSGPSKYLLGKGRSCLVSRAVTLHQIAQMAADFLDQKGL